MPPAQGDFRQILHVAADALDLVQGGAGGHEGKGPSLQLFQGLLPHRQAEPVHGGHGEAALSDFKEGPGVDRAALVGGDGEGHLLNHGPEDPSLHGNGILVLHLGKVGVIRRGEAGDIKVRVAAEEADL